MESALQAQADMTEAERMVRDYYKTIEMQPFAEGPVSNFFAEDYRNYPPRKVEGTSVKAGTMGLLKNLSQGFPDAKRTLIVVEPLSEGRVLAYFSFDGTHTGSFFGFAPTGNKVSFVGVDIFKIKDRKFVENWHVEDLSTFFEQIKAR